MHHRQINNLLKKFKFILFLILLLTEQSVYSQENILAKNADLDSNSCIKLDSLFEQYKLTDFVQSKQICFEAITLGKSLNNNYILEHWYQNLGDLNTFFEMNANAAKYYAKGLLYSQKTKKQDYNWYITIGNMYLADKQYLKAKEFYQKAYAHYATYKDSIKAIEKSAEALANIARVYQALDIQDSALIFLKKSLQLRKKNTNEDIKIKAYLQIANCFIRFNIPDSCSVYIDSAYLLDQHSQKHIFLPNIILLETHLLQKENKTQWALNKAIEAEKILLHQNNHRLLLKTYLIITDILLQQHKYKATEKYIQKALALINYPDNTSQKADLLKKAANIYHLLGDDNKSYNYLQQYSLYADSIMNSQLISVLSEFENEVHKSSLKTVTKNLASEQEKSTFYLNTVIIGILLFLVLSILLYLIFKKSAELKDSLKWINQQNSIIEQQYQEILQKNKMLEKYKNDLEELVHEQTHDLIEAKEQAEHADRLKTSFLENLSHEVRTPLNAITGFAEVLQYEENLPENVKTYIDHINTAGESLLRIIDSIIQLSDIQSSNYLLNISKFKAVEPVYKIIYEFKNSKEFRTSKNIEIRAEINIDTKQTIRSDENALNTILYHLADNSIKFTKKGYVEIGVCPYDENYLLYFVKDTGIGIHQEDIKFIFDRFRKADSGNKNLYRGLGMGLSIVKNLIERMGGEIWLDTETQKGSVFYFCIPIDFDDAPKCTKS